MRWTSDGESLPRHKLGRDYTKFWAAQSISYLGSQVTVFALPLVATITLHASAPEMGAFVAVQQIPSAVAAPLIGPFADWLPKRNLLISLNAASAIFTAVIPVLFEVGLLDFSLLATVAFILMAMAAAFDVTYVSFVPELVPAEGLLQANGRLEGAYSVAQVAGPALGGILVSVLHAPIALLVDSFSFAVSGVVLIWLSKVSRESEVRYDASIGQYWSEIRLGMSAVWNDRTLRLMSVGSGTFNLFAGAATAVTVIFVIRELRMSPSWFGVATAIGATGGVAGAASARRIDSVIGTPLTIVGSLAICSIGESVLAVTPAGHRLIAIILVAAGQFAGAWGVTVFLISSLTMRQKIIPRASIGSTYGSMRLLSRGAIPLGAVISGMVAPEIGLRSVIAIAAAGQLATAVQVGLHRRSLEAAEAGRRPS